MSGYVARVKGQRPGKMVTDPNAPNVFFQSAMLSGAHPAPKDAPRHWQLPDRIHFFIRSASSGVDLSLHHPLPPEIVSKYIMTAKPHRGYEGAGPACRCEFTSDTVYGLMAHQARGHETLVIMVPSTDAFPRQDPRVKAHTLTFQPGNLSSLHIQSDAIYPKAIQLPRVLIPLKMQDCHVERVLEATALPGQAQLALIKWRHLKEPTWEKATSEIVTSDERNVSALRAFLRSEKSASPSSSAPSSFRNGMGQAAFTSVGGAPRDRRLSITPKGSVAPHSRATLVRNSGSTLPFIGSPYAPKRRPENPLDSHALDVLPALPDATTASRAGMESDLILEGTSTHLGDGWVAQTQVAEQDPKRDPQQLESSLPVPSAGSDAGEEWDEEGSWEA
eukprot:CAMPEP_0181224958 /NCGR_PEP_ID=MMETSP1096-20121128/31421_1 /TAXON_ID=156174 ORGANISM="Chrysochromulina ericina, Strain CCMP281" /NCGR_SAMPLE_ID=MMETSP1096 /ASSEMBLY_ACC=CAM_ASM_000453 /LENGTH=389 /DNA_ID=CAMNT_0023318109 /DNA_START=24 /DNA_END=1190 /DNA_ORIENTATION=+